MHASPKQCAKTLLAPISVNVPLDIPEMERLVVLVGNFYKFNDDSPIPLNFDLGEKSESYRHN